MQRNNPEKKFNFFSPLSPLTFLSTHPQNNTDKPINQLENSEVEKKKVCEPMVSAVATAKKVLDNLFRAPLQTLALLREHHSHLWPCPHFGLWTDSAVVECHRQMVLYGIYFRFKVLSASIKRYAQAVGAGKWGEKRNLSSFSGCGGK